MSSEMTREEAEAVVKHGTADLYMLLALGCKRDIAQHAARCRMVDDIITAARAAGAAEERERECVWRSDESIAELATSSGAALDCGGRIVWHAEHLPYCQRCGGRVRIAEEANAQPT